MVSTIKNLIPEFILIILTKRNYRLRKEGKSPDKWYWADSELIKRGYGGYDLWWINNG